MVTIYDGLTRSELDFDYKNCSMMRHEYHLAEGTKAVGMVGMLTEWKGFHVFLQAAKYVLEEYHDVVFFVVGDSISKEVTSYKEFLHSMAIELDISNNVFFYRSPSRFKERLRGARHYIHASLTPEPFGRVIIEAMAAAKPVIAVNAGGPAEIIQHGQTGLLYSPGDAHELARHIMLPVE